MGATSYTSARANLAATLERVCSDHDPLIITRPQAPSVVMVSLEDYQALAETANLLRSPVNARRLFAGIDPLEAGKGKVRKLPR
jgi:antitoxin YefM